MPGIFAKIIGGEIPSYKIAEDEYYYAFLDINPLAKGHTLVIPKVEVDYIFDLDDDLLSGLHLFSKKVAKALESVIDCKRVGVLVIGTEVPHAHIHLIPFKEERQMAITSDRVTVDAEEMAEIGTKVSAAYLNLYSKKSTLVFGASLKPERYSNKAMKMLSSYDHHVLAIGGREGVVDDISVMKGHPALENVDTITMYMGETRQQGHEEYLLSLKPRRIIFNPGAENREFAKQAIEHGIVVEEACTLVLLRTGQY